MSHRTDPTRGLRLWHKSFVYVTIVASLTPLIRAPEVSRIALALVAAGLVASWFLEPPRFQPERYQPIRTLVTLVLVFGMAFWIAFGGQSLLLGGLYVVLFLLVVKMTNRTTSRDNIQIMALALMTLATGTVLDQDVSFGLSFAVFALSGTVAFSLNHLVASVQEHTLDPSHGRLVGLPFIFGLLALSVVVFSVSMTFFFAFPRVGIGLFMSQSRPGITMAGFNDNIELDDHGVVRDNETVVMRVIFPDLGREASIEQRHWRGLSYDYFDGSKWSRTEDIGPQYLPDDEGRVRVWGKFRHLPDESFTMQEIYLEPIEWDVLFGLHYVVELQLADSLGEENLELFGRRVRVDPSGDMHLTMPNEFGLRYMVKSYVPPPIDPATVPTGKQRAHAYFDPYLQLPADLSPDIVELANEITAGAQNELEKAILVERYLRENYAYTTDLPKRSDDPLHDFLFEQKIGHCEFFSTAMAILLRAVDVPTRNVNGFLGGDWNQFGNYYSVREGDAHSWVEVYIRRHGWIEFDPTPSQPEGSVEGERGWFALIGDYVDSLRMQWYQWIVEYDLVKQLSLLRSSVSFADMRKDSRRKAWKELGASIKRNALPFLIVLALCTAWAIVARRRSRGAPSVREKAAGLVLIAICFTLIELTWRPAPDTFARTYALVAPIIALFAAYLRKRTVLAREQLGTPRDPVGRRLFKFLRYLSGLGFQRARDETVTSFLRRLRREGVPFELEPIERWHDRYLSFRFGDTVRSRKQVRTLSRELKGIRRSIARSHK